MLELLKKRRSIRKYKKKSVEKEKIDIIIKAVLLSPSSRNLNPWEFIIIDDKILLGKLSRSKVHGSSFLKNAPLAILVIAQHEKCDVWIEDCSIASIIIQLTAESIGLSSCWIQIRQRFHDSGITSEDYIKKIMKIDNKYKIESIIAIGYNDEIKMIHTEEELNYNKIHKNSFK
ncbi:MAG: nitroreductase family protein [Spirochaetes bacterium]|nr:nitroreductase family protein [Spirochaetota bacterium]